MSLWEQRDLPVLRALAQSDDAELRDHGVLRVGKASALGLDLSPGELHDAVLTLGDAGYVEGRVEYSSGPDAMFTHFRVTARGMQALGQWPLFDEIASPETLALLLERLADEAPTDEEASNMRRAAAYVRSVSGASLRALTTAAISQLARSAAGLS